MNRLSELHRRLSASERLNAADRLLLVLLTPLGWLYGIIAWLRVSCYRLGIFRSWRPPVPVVSVGNLAVGGTGKTPTVDAVAKHFLAAGRRVAIVSRGYGAPGGKSARIVCCGEGPLLSADICGDEPLLLARRNPTAIVIVARKRARGVHLAIERLGAQIVILDDGFQHLAVQRDIDLVLLDCRSPLGNRQVLPAGILREFPAALRRADLFLLTRCGSETDTPEGLPGPVFRSRHRLSKMAFPLQGETVPLESLRERKGVAFAGIADPELFFRQLREEGLSLTETVAFGDHVPYDDNDLARLKRAAADADFLITTEKDAVKLADRTFVLPCYQVPLELKIEQHDELMSYLDALIK